LPTMVGKIRKKNGPRSNEVTLGNFLFVYFVNDCTNPRRRHKNETVSPGWPDWENFCRSSIFLIVQL
jgi:hypothetical protein